MKNYIKSPYYYRSLQCFPSGVKGWGASEMLLEEMGLWCGVNLSRSDFDHSNLFQS